MGPRRSFLDGTESIRGRVTQVLADVPDGLYEYRAPYSPGLDMRPPVVGHLSTDGVVVPERVSGRRSVSGFDVEFREHDSLGDFMSQGSFNHSTATECFPAPEPPYTDDSLLD